MLFNFEFQILSIKKSKKSKVTLIVSGGFYFQLPNLGAADEGD